MERGERLLLTAQGCISLDSTEKLMRVLRDYREHSLALGCSTTRLVMFPLIKLLRPKMGTQLECFLAQ